MKFIKAENILQEIQPSPPPAGLLEVIESRIAQEERQSLPPYWSLAASLLLAGFIGLNAYAIFGSPSQDTEFLDEADTIVEELQLDDQYALYDE